MKKLLFLFSMAASLSFFFITVSVTSCNSGTKDSLIKEPCPPVVKDLIGTNFYELSMLQKDYEDLKAFFNPPPPTVPDPNKMLVQFYFDKTETNPPSLIAYSSQIMNHVTKPVGPSDVTFSKILTITDKKGLLVPDKFVLGDQQVSFSLIDGLIAGAAIPAGTNYTLIFKPQQNIGEINISYQICVKYIDGTGNPIEVCGGHAVVNTQPSPPANAN